MAGAAADPDQTSVVECLNCGMRRELPEHECERCSYVGWAMVTTPAPTIAVSFRRRETVFPLRHLHAV